MRSDIFRAYDRFLGGSKQEREGTMGELRKCEEALARLPNYLNSEAYRLLSNIKIVCLGQLGKY